MAALGLTVVVIGAPSVSIVHAHTNGRPVPSRAQIERPRGDVPHVKRGQDRRARAATGANSNCPKCAPPLVYAAGQEVIGGQTGVAGHVTVVSFYWEPSGYVYTPTYRSIIDGYIANVAQASAESTNAFSLSRQYYQQGTAAGAPIVHLDLAVTAGADVDDTNAFPAQGGATGCTADPGYTDCVSDDALKSELTSKLTAASQPMDDSHVYVVLLPSGVEACESPATPSAPANCSGAGTCAYHNAKVLTKGVLLYTNQPFPKLNGCADPYNGPQAPNGDSYADAQVSLVSHEVNEVITDWAGAWADSAGSENGDECAYVYGAPVGSTGVGADSQAAGTLYNQVIGSGKYYTQEEFSNEDYAAGIGDPTATGGTVVPGCRGQEERPVAFTADPTGCRGASFEYWELPPTGSIWIPVRAYSTSNTFTWSGGAAGPYRFGVRVRQPGSTASYEAYAIITYWVTT